MSTHRSAVAIFSTKIQISTKMDGTIRFALPLCIQNNELLGYLKLRPQTHMIRFPHPLQTYMRYLRTFLWCGWEDGSTIMQRPICLLAQSFGGCPYSWVAGARLHNMMSWCIGWGPRPTCYGSHTLKTYTRCLRTYLCCGWEDGSAIMPLSPYLLA